MSSQSPALPPLSAELAAFMQGGVSISAATRDESLRTSLARVYGCRISADRQRITIVLNTPQATTLLADLRANGQIAVVFSQPSSNRTVQFKGSDAIIEPCRPIDHDCVIAHTEAFAADLLPFGEFSETLIHAVMCSAPEESVAVSFTPCQAFRQTPGPAAGEPLT